MFLTLRYLNRHSLVGFTMHAYREISHGQEPAA